MKILGNLRAAATPTTQLVVIDNVIPYACNDTQQSIDVPGASDIRPIAPPPLLPNFGAASLMTYLGDLTVRNHILDFATQYQVLILVLYRCSII